MSEREYSVQPVGVEYACDECGEIMKVMGSALPNGMIPHVCSNSHMAALPQGYPLIRFDRVTEAQRYAPPFEPTPEVIHG